MTNYSDSPMDKLWKEYGEVFSGFDDLTLGRWMAQTLGQIHGRSWRLSHPLVGAYRLAAQAGHERQIWLKRLVNIPSGYIEAPCCRAPLLPLLTRDVAESGLICQHCGECCAPFEELPPEIGPDLRIWAELYRPIHAVAHWDEAERSSRGHYEGHLEDAAKEAEKLLAQAGATLAPRLLDYYAAAVWEDQDDCLEVRPEDLEF